MNEAVNSNWTVQSFLYTKELPLSNWAQEIITTVPTLINYELTKELMKDLSNKEDTSELLAIVKMRKDSFDQISLSSNPILALFDRPSNKGNLGTILRSCDALGVDGLIITGHAVDLYDPEVIVSSMGSFFHVPAIRMADNNSIFAIIDSLKVRFPEFQVIGTTAHKEHSLYNLNLTTPLMFLIGNETDGLCHAFQEKADILATIPMSSTSSASSFNVSCAATVMFYEAVRQRNFI